MNTVCGTVRQGACLSRAVSPSMRNAGADRRLHRRVQRCASSAGQVQATLFDVRESTSCAATYFAKSNGWPPVQRQKIVCFLKLENDTLFDVKNEVRKL